MVFGIENLKKKPKHIVLYKNDLLLQMLMYAHVHQFALYANGIWN